MIAMLDAASLPKDNPLKPVAGSEAMESIAARLEIISASDLHAAELRAAVLAAAG
jgi:hypothetical protein